MVVAAGRRRAAGRPRYVSVINKMLQELDRRNATAGTQAEQAPRQVKAVVPSRPGHEWFWRIVAALMLSAVGWVGWVAYQLQPGPALATKQAFKAAEKARTGRVSEGQVPAPALSPPTQAPPPEPPTAAATSSPEKEPARQSETMRLAQSIQTPIAERPSAAAETPKSAPPAPRSGATREELPAIKAPAPKAGVDKRERTKPRAQELAEAQFRRAAVLLNQGRVSEAEEQLVGALQADPAHVPARQAYVALLLEQQRSDAARRVLDEAVAIDPSQPTFALALARILAEQRDYPGALQVIDRAGSAGSNADFLALRGAVLQRMQRHAEAIEAYQASIRGAPQPGTTWVGYAISLEAVGRKSDAAQAYRRSLGAGGLTREVRDYAEGRIRALE